MLNATSQAGVVKLVDTRDLKSLGDSRAGSSPAARTRCFPGVISRIDPGYGGARIGRATMAYDEALVQQFREGLAGFPSGTLSFLRGLEANNTREWFTAHKADYDAR